MPEALSDAEVELVRHDVAITADESFLGRFLATVDSVRAERDEALRRAEKAERRTKGTGRLPPLPANIEDDPTFDELERVRAERDRQREALDELRSLHKGKELPFISGLKMWCQGCGKAMPCATSVILEALS